MHLWLIIDWNRRWAKNLWKQSLYGHKAWFDNVETILELAYDRWIEVVSIWALSKENIKKRSKLEIEWLTRLIGNLPKFLPKFNKFDAKFETIWDLDLLPKKTIATLDDMKLETMNYTTRKVIIALWYSGQDEIVRATKKIIKSWINPDTLDEVEFKKYLDTSKYPAPDLIIRTGWVSRHSGFMLYDSAYSEYYFSEKLWPDFDEMELDRALEYFNNTERRFWK